MKDREVLLPNRRKITYADGSVEYVTIEYADQPSEEGTSLSKATFLTDTTATALGLNPEDDPLVDDALLSLSNHHSHHSVGGSDELPEIAEFLQTFAMINSGGVFAGGVVTAQGTPNQTVAVSSGAVLTPEGRPYAFDSVSSLAATAADVTNPRIDIVYVTSAGVVTYLAGTAAASPAQPSIPSNGTILAAVTRAANDNTIATSDITDHRDFITTANDFEDVTSVTENTNAFACDFAKKHTKNFSFSITNTTAKTVTFTNVPYGTCDSIISIKATGTAAVTWTLDGRTLVWPAGAPTLTSGYTYEILFTYNILLAKWIGRAQLGAAN